MSNSFFEKLKKGMDLEKTLEKELKEEEKKEEIEEIPIKLGDNSSSTSASAKATADKKEEDKEEKKKSSPTGEKKEKMETKKPKEKSSSTLASDDKEWPKPEGQLAVDVYQTESELVIQSAIAGVKPEELDISVEGDLVIIKGERKRPVEENKDYFFQECYWGSFSRKIILPVEVDPGRIDANLKNGILTIRMPKILREKKMKVTIKSL